ncbi:MAG: MlaD family protein [Burkholderiaceae bacterium]|jgi:ABC-type transporter Mla subunit MlaD|nr:MlaD family protein [Burkholderiaceae bacterium]
MEADARYTYVGLAVLALVAALVGAVVWLKNVGAERDFTRYAIHFEQQALDGLSIGADVNLRGIKVGRVEDYGLVGDGFNRVRVEVRVDRRAPVTTKTVAIVSRNLITGIASITLVNTEPGGEPLTAGTRGESLPLIAEGLSERELIAGRVSEVGDMASSVLSNLNHLLSPDNRALLVDTVRSVRDLSDGLAARLAALDRTLERTGAAAASAGDAATRLAAAGEEAAAAAARTGDRVAAVGEQTGSQLQRTLAEAEQTLVQARAALDQLSTSVVALQRDTAATARRLEVSAAGVEDQLGAALADLRLSVDAAARTLDRLRDPRAALLGPSAAQLGPGEVRP